jgi:hypothetical protein
MKALPLLLIGLALLALPAPAEATYLDKPKLFEVSGPYTHPPSGMKFPADAGVFRREQLVQYDVEALDVSAGYSFSSSAGRIVATIYIYPAPSLNDGVFPKDAATQAKGCGQEFADRKNEVETVHPDARLVQESTAPTPAGETLYFGRKAVYEFNVTSEGERVPVQSVLYVYCYVGGKWAFEYRFTYARTFRTAPEMITKLMRDVRWTVRPAP